MTTDDDRRVACANCGWTGTELAAEPVRDFWSRVYPGEVCPAGDCPKCGALCHLEQAEESALLARYKRLHDWLSDTIESPETDPWAPSSPDRAWLVEELATLANMTGAGGGDDEHRKAVIIPRELLDRLAYVAALHGMHDGPDQRKAETAMQMAHQYLRIAPSKHREGVERMYREAFEDDDPASPKTYRANGE